jgi:hypothetical protein
VLAYKASNVSFEAGKRKPEMTKSRRQFDGGTASSQEIFAAGARFSSGKNYPAISKIGQGIGRFPLESAGYDDIAN